MAIRIPRGYAVSRPYYNELCEGVRPVAGSLPREAWTGLAHVRIDELHHDPIVLEPGTLVGIVTGGASIGEGKLVPAVLGTGYSDAGNLIQVGSSNVWGLPTASGAANVGRVKPQGVCYQPIYSFNLQASFTNYTRNTAVGILTDYVIQIPAVNSDEWLIEPGDAIMLGSGKRHGIAFTAPDATYASHAAGSHLAGRYAPVKTYAALYNDIHDRIVGKCLRKVKIGSDSRGASAIGATILESITNGTFSINSAYDSEIAYISKTQTVPGLTGLTGSGTKGVPGFYLGAKADAAGDFFGLTLLIRI
jgi:hypothetical protein